MANYNYYFHVLYGLLRMCVLNVLFLQAPCKKFYGHSDRVTSVRFLHDDSHLLSAGGDDSW